MPDETPRRCFYVSIPFFKHEVYKAAGRVGDAEHERFYLDHFAKNGTLSEGPEKGPFKVKILPYCGDRITGIQARIEKGIAAGFAFGIHYVPEVEE